MVPDPRSEPGRTKRLEEIKFDEFTEEFNKFPKGNPQRTFNALRFAVAFDVTFFGNPVTKDEIYKGWTLYLATCEVEERENRFKKSMESFIKSKDYQNVEPEESKETWLDKLKKGNQDDDYEL